MTIIGRLSDTAISGTRVTNQAQLRWWPGDPAVFASAAFRVVEPGCRPVQAPAIQWAPGRPRPHQTVTLSATVAGGDVPIPFSWDLGDGGIAQGQVVTHTYGQAGSYTVTLSATNCGGSGSAVVRETVVVPAYLPLILREN